MSLNYYHYFPCLTALPLNLHSLSSVISNCLNLLFGTQGRPRRLKPFSTSKKRGDHRGAFVPGRASQDPAQFQSPFSFIYFFIFIFWLCWVFVAARGLFSSCSKQGLLSVVVRRLLIGWLLLLQSTGSRRVGFSSCGSWALERRLSSCGARA